MVRIGKSPAGISLPEIIAKPGVWCKVPRGAAAGVPPQIMAIGNIAHARRPPGLHYLAAVTMISTRHLRTRSARTQARTGALCGSTQAFQSAIVCLEELHVCTPRLTLGAASDFGRVGNQLIVLLGDGAGLRERQRPLRSFGQSVDRKDSEFGVLF